MLKERDEAGRNGNELLRRNVHVLDLLGLDLDEVSAVTRRDRLPKELSLAVEGRVCLGNVEVLVTVAGQILDLIGHLAIDDLAVRGLDEAEVVDAGIGAKRADQTDVRTFRGLDRADAAVVRWMNVTHLKTGALTGETTGPKSRETALVSELGEGVRLIHELAQLGTTKEITDNSAQ